LGGLIGNADRKVFFGVLPARESAISILELLLWQLSGWKVTPLNDNKLGRLFRILPRKLRGYLIEN
jgi:hypothetical protein